MFCSKCGNKMPDNSTFCPICGEQVRPEIIDNNQILNNPGVGAPSNGFIPIAPPPYPLYGQQQNVQQYSQYGQAPPYGQPTIVHTNIYSNFNKKSPNALCVTSFVLSILSIFFLGIVFGPLSFILGLIGVINFDEENQSCKWMGITGFILGAAASVIMIIFIQELSIFF